MQTDIRDNDTTASPGVSINVAREIDKWRRLVPDDSRPYVSDHPERPVAHPLPSAL